MFKKIASVVAGAALLVGGVAVGSNLAQSPAPTKVHAQATAVTQTPVEYYGAIRCENGVWSAIEDSGHTPVGIGTITATSTYVQVNHTHVDKVGKAQYSGDNDYPNYGIVVNGASGGLDYDRFTFFKNGALLNPASACDKAYTNVWVDGKGYLETP